MYVLTADSAKQIHQSRIQHWVLSVICAYDKNNWMSQELNWGEQAPQADALSSQAEPLVSKEENTKHCFNFTFANLIVLKIF